MTIYDPSYAEPLAVPIDFDGMQRRRDIAWQVRPLTPLTPQPPSPLEGLGQGPQIAKQGAGECGGAKYSFFVEFLPF